MPGISALALAWLLPGILIGAPAAGVGDAVAALRPVAPALAAALARYGARSGQSGMTASWPGGLPCPALP